MKWRSWISFPQRHQLCGLGGAEGVSGMLSDRTPVEQVSKWTGLSKEGVAAFLGSRYWLQLLLCNDYKFRIAVRIGPRISLMPLFRDRDGRKITYLQYCKDIHRLFTVTPGAIFFISPCNTFPGPHTTSC